MLTTLSATVRNQIYQQLFFHFVHWSVNIITWSFYAALLLRASNNNVFVVLLNQGVMHIGLMLGFVIAGIWFSKLGYLHSFQISNLLQVLVCAYALFTLPHVLDHNLIVALLWGLMAGFHWQARHAFHTNIVHGKYRSWLMSVSFAMETGLTIALPVLVGGLIFTWGYEWVFVAGMVIAGVAIVYPWQHNVFPDDKLKWSELKRIIKQRGFYPWAAIIIGDEILLNLRIATLLVIPFLFIGDEFGLGAFMSLVGLFSALLAFTHRTDLGAKRIHYGYIGASLVTVVNIMMLVFWGLPGLLVRSLLANLGFALLVPVANDINYKNRELIVRDFKHQYSLEVQQYSEFFLFIARMVTLVWFILLFTTPGVDTTTALKIIWGLSILRELPSLYFSAQLRKYLSHS